MTMIDDMASLKQAMVQMDSEDATVAQTGKDRAAQILEASGLSFAKLAELIQRRRLLLPPSVLGRIKRMDQPGTLGDSAFRATWGVLRKEGQSFLQIAEALEVSGGLRPGDDAEASALRQRTAQLSAEAAMDSDGRTPPTALTLALDIVTFPLRHPIRFLTVAVLGLVLFYGYRGAVTLGQQVSSLFDGAAARRASSGAGPAPPASPAVTPSQTASSPATAPPPPASAATPSPIPAPTEPAPADLARAPSPPAPAAPASPPASSSRRDARIGARSRFATECGAARDGSSTWSRRCPSVGDERRPRAFEDMVPAAIRRDSRQAGPCIGGVGGCFWGGLQH
ncbi:hypothetical protein BRADO1978 [Bradyrhizobium sp. ORS 278]|uniref:hypothetical protein n=1 Tax=Bradyrhizobium sp. (strain ORS 278) TaxID=114615 RepID=UPI000150761C|nr:hypothetical protein [Bradyrhizobium sp. ORS 278]CAL75840.1 hypothetical protein BRADO1978 [Bradyrhizobium sp. ORS 278]